VRESFIELYGALAVFILSHSLPPLPRVRGKLTGLLGERLYLAIYSLVSLGTLAWLFLALGRAPYLPLWPYWSAAAWLPLLAMPVSFVLFALAVVTPNPLSIPIRPAAYDPARPGSLVVTRHPLLWAFVVWAAAHLIANGDLAAALVFGLFLILAGLGMVMLDRKRRRQLGVEEWQRLAAATSLLPLAAVITGRGEFVPRRRELLAGFAGLLGYAGFLHLHEMLIGVPPWPP
jgi:uncharacterized membrane protein